MKKLFIIIIFFISLILFVYCPNITHAICENLSKEECSIKISELEEEVKQLSNKGKTLSSQIQYMDSQITLTEAKITNTQSQIKTTEEEIDSLSSQIITLNTALDKLTQILLYKITEGYKKRNVSLLDVFLDPNNALVLLNNFRYIQAAQNSDHYVAVKIERTRLSFEEQKSLREEKKQELESLKKMLDSQKINLKTQKEQKQTLLTQTNSDEKKYRQLLQQALGEYEAIQKAMTSGTHVGPVKKGDPIALVGNSGYPHCSTGAHLHFEVRKDGAWSNPRDYINSGWRWPLDEPIIITQEYGKTPWSWRYQYSDGVHTGIDMVSDSSSVIKAPTDGELYTSSQKCQTATINVKYIDHGGGIVSFYLHVQ